MIIPLHFLIKNFLFHQFQIDSNFQKKQHTSINERIANIDEKDSKAELNSDQTSSVDVLRDSMSIPQTKFLKRAWEEKTTTHPKLNNIRFKKAQEESRNFYFKSKTIIGRRIKNGMRPPRLNRNIDSFESINENAEVEDVNPIKELPVIELEESKDSSRRPNTNLDILTTNKNNKTHKELENVSHKNIEESSYDKVEAFSSRRSYEDKTSDINRWKTKRMTSDVGLLSKRMTTNVNEVERESENNEDVIIDEESQHLI